MKKMLVAKLALAGTIGVFTALAAGSASANDCSQCHTMHNSQNGQSMRFDGMASPLAILLRDDCIGCHSGRNTTNSLLNSPPKVIGTAQPLYTPIAGGAGTAFTSLAGGDFWWVISDSTKGHDVANAVGHTDSNGLTAPGGTATSVTCAGTKGCHGNSYLANELQSLAGAHHSRHTNWTQPLLTGTGGNVGASFRYLIGGVYGAEDTDWQFTETTDHNQYYGEARTTDVNSATGASNTHTISALCATCHGAYHNKVDGGTDTYGINQSATFAGTGAWIRHPTDYDVPTTVGTEYEGFKTYQPETPVGRTNAAGAVLGSAVPAPLTAGNRIVLCVSCHRAHGSPYADALRWRYSTMAPGTGVTNGCMNCHTKK